MVLSPNFLPTLCKALQIMLKQPFLKVTILTAQLKTVTFAIDLSQNKTRLYTLLSPSYKFSKKRKKKKERKKEKKKKKKTFFNISLPSLHLSTILSKTFYWVLERPDKWSRSCVWDLQVHQRYPDWGETNVLLWVKPDWGETHSCRGAHTTCLSCFDQSRTLYSLLSSLINSL